MKTVKIKGYSRYTLREDGVITNILSGQVLNGGINNSGYLQYRLTNDVGIATTWGIHRLLGWVFLTNFGNLNGLVVNHLDGNKLNNKLSNFEITTHQGNCEHAGLNGLSEKCKPISVRDIKTGIVKKYPSVISFVRENNSYTKDIISSRCHKGEKYSFDGLQYKFGFDDFSIDDPVENTGRFKPVLVRDVWTNEVVEYTSSVTAAFSLMVSPSSISKYISDPSQPVIPGFKQICLAEDFTGWIDHEDPVLNYESNSDVRCVVTWKDDEGYTLHLSATKAAKHLNIKTTALNYRLKLNTDKTFSDGSKCFYYEWSPLCRNYNG